jgi:Na+/proline symporter
MIALYIFLAILGYAFIGHLFKFIAAVCDEKHDSSEHNALIYFWPIFTVLVVVLPFEILKRIFDKLYKALKEKREKYKSK